MSSTNRGYNRHPSDFYITPDKTIKDFWEAFTNREEICGTDELLILDPCAGGSKFHVMPYPAVLADANFRNIITNDIRPDSPARFHFDYLGGQIMKQTFEQPFDIIISNPPFSYALAFIEMALNHVAMGGFVIFLLRLSFFASQKRKDFFKDNMPRYCYVHSSRPSFFPVDITWAKPDGTAKLYKAGSTDSSEYAHFIWEKGSQFDYCKTFVI